jgi:hypothetical protein
VSEQDRRDEEVEHPEVDRAYARDEGGQVPEEDTPREDTGPDRTGDRSAEDEDEPPALETGD